MKLKIITVVGTRPEIIRLSRIIKKLDFYFHHILVHTGQNYDETLNEVFFKDLDIESPEIYLDCSKTNCSPKSVNNFLAISGCPGFWSITNCCACLRID